MESKQIHWIKRNWHSFNETQKYLYLEQIKTHYEIKQLWCLTELNKLSQGGSL